MAVMDRVTDQKLLLKQRHIVYNASYVTMMIDFLVHTFILEAQANHKYPNVVDCTALADNVLEITMTDETVFLVNVEKLDISGKKSS